jgi:hypothetical protein
LLSSTLPLLDRWAMSAAHPSYATTEMEDWDRSMGVVVVPLTPPRTNTSLPGEPGSPRRRLAEMMKLHGAGSMEDMSDDEEEYLSEALGDWVCKKFQAPSAGLDAFLI